ncbi:unnamed protein product [Allacma fusca]|uniref:Uncharacterized protein n=1 Tax=Allacma fusca TaxID=39272 RepID=A0A8J2JF42_9HEXA|nr:unnamed protein product [Allacma fusca]
MIWPLVNRHIPSVYSGVLDKVFIHHDTASSNTARKPQAHAQDVRKSTGVKIIKNSDMPIKSPNASQMDLFGFGYHKKRLGRRAPTTENGLWKVLQETLRKVDLSMVNQVYRP